MMDRDERLLSDYEKVKLLAQRSPYIHLERVTGNPPDEYLIRFTCKGIAKLEHEQPVWSEDHLVEIRLGPSYPDIAPDRTWKTPIFHPNISTNGNVCVGYEWARSRYLDDFLVFLAQMVRYEGTGLTFLTDQTPYRSEAYQWAKNNKHLFPVDKRPLIRDLGVRVLSNSYTSQIDNNDKIRVVGKTNLG